jgi:hypothetical protein
MAKWSAAQSHYAAWYIRGRLYRKRPVAEAARDAIENNPDPLIAILCSGYPLTLDDRLCIAAYFTGLLKRPRRRPPIDLNRPPPNGQFAAHRVRRAADEFRKQAGPRCKRGERPALLAEIAAKHCVDEQRLHNYLNRYRRKAQHKFRN